MYADFCSCMQASVHVCRCMYADFVAEIIRPGFHIIVRSHKRDADSLRPSSSVSRLICFHIEPERPAKRAMIQSRQSIGQEPRELC